MSEQLKAPVAKQGGGPPANAPFELVPVDSNRRWGYRDHVTITPLAVDVLDDRLERRLHLLAVERRRRPHRQRHLSVVPGKDTPQPAYTLSGFQGSVSWEC